MTTSHTPIPWDLIQVCDEITIRGSNEQSICDMVHKRDYTNADLIVRAVNSHYELLEALKNIRAAGEVKGVKWSQYLSDQMDAAIAKAEGGAA